MIKNKLDNFDVVTLNYFITRAFLTGYLFNSLLILIKQDSWIIPIFGILIGIIFSFRRSLPFFCIRKDKFDKMQIPLCV